MWQPSCTIDTLKRRAEIIATIREFFRLRHVIEVETPVLSQGTVTDPYLTSLTSTYLLPGTKDPATLYLQTSPEYAMKRLLAAGSGAIYQISKAFRDDRLSTQHNPEFTLLEWYRPGFSHHDLMIEIDGLLRKILQCESAQCFHYGELFQQYCAIDPYQTSVTELKNCAELHGLVIHHAETILDITTWLQLLMSELIEPHLGFNQRPAFVIDFPSAQAALARINPGPPPTAERFEVYWQGMELANGFHELLDPTEQRRRLMADNAYRIANDLSEIPLDERFLAALEHGLPACSGVALGIDRLMMAALGHKRIQDVMPFPVDRA